MLRGRLCLGPRFGRCRAAQVSVSPPPAIKKATSNSRIFHQGPYHVFAELTGFKRYERGPLEVRVGDVLSIDIQMEVGAVTENITVTSEAPLLEAASAGMGQVIDNRRIIDLPLPGASSIYLTQLTPGVISTNPPTHGWLPQAVDAVSNIAVAGTRTRSLANSPSMAPRICKAEGRSLFRCLPK